MTGRDEVMPPHDILAEQASLGAMMLSAGAVTDVTGIIRSTTDYYRPLHHAVYDAIVAMARRGAPVDAITVADELRRRGELRGALDAPYLHTLIHSVPTAASAAHYARIVRDCADRRDLLAEAARLEQAARDPGTDPAIARARSVAVLAAGQRDEQQAIAEAHLAAIPAYPAGALCGPLRQLVESGAKAGLHPALVGGAGLAALATVSGRADISVTGTWTERPALWVALVAPRGAGKTPAQGYAYRRLREIDAQRHEIYREELRDWINAPRKERGDPPPDPTRLIDDVTLEMTARWLDRGDATGGVDVDELAGWLRRMGRYHASGDGGERGRWLSLWSAAAWRYQRVGSDVDILVARPVLSVCGGIQPPLHSLLGGEEDGLRPRWLPHLATIDVPAAGPGYDGPVTTWDSTISALYDARHHRAWELTGNGLARWNTARIRWRQDMAGSESASVSAGLAKADMQAARIALVLAESMRPGEGGAVPEEAVGAAVAITDYVVGCWRAMPDREALTTSRRDETLHRGVGQLADWLEQHGGRASRRELQRACVAGARTAADLDALLARYEAEYPGSVREGERTGPRGPATTVVYAPRRGSSPSPSGNGSSSGGTVSADSSAGENQQKSRRKTGGRKTGGQRERTVGTADSSAADSYSPTVSVTSGNDSQSAQVITLPDAIPGHEEWSA